VVWVMPGEAFKLGCTDHVKPIMEIAQQVITLTQGRVS
jgi:two-component system chemotaxis response regulator CheB